MFTLLTVRWAYAYSSTNNTAPPPRHAAGGEGKAMLASTAPPDMWGLGIGHKLRSLFKGVHDAFLETITA